MTKSNLSFETGYSLENVELIIKHAYEPKSELDYIRKYYPQSLVSEYQESTVVKSNGKFLCWYGIAVIYTFPIADLFFISSKDFRPWAKDNILCCTYIVKQIILHCKYLLATKFNRVECRTNANYPHYGKFAKIAGFKQEGIMKCFGPNKEDYILWSMT